MGHIYFIIKQGHTHKINLLLYIYIYSLFSRQYVLFTQQVLSKMQYLFELTEHRPPYWGPPESFNHSSKER